MLGAAGTGVAFRHDLARVAVEETLAAGPPARAAPAGARRAGRPRRRRPGSPITPRAPATRSGAALRARRGRARGRGRRPPRGRGAVRAAPCASPTALAARGSAPSCTSGARTSATWPTSPREAIEDLRARARLPPASSATAAARATCCARCRASSGAPASSTRPSVPGHDAVALLEPLGPEPRARDGLREHGLAGHEPRGRRAAPPSWGERALELARALGDEAIEIHALNSIGTMEFLVRRAGRPRDRRAQPRARARRRPDRRCPARVRRTWSGRPCATARYPLAERYLERGDRATRATPSSTCGGSTCSATAPASSSTRAAGRRRPRRRRSILRGRRASPLPVIARADRDRPPARPPRRPGSVGAARRGARARRAGAAAARAGRRRPAPRRRG